MLKLLENCSFNISPNICISITPFLTNTPIYSLNQNMAQFLTANAMLQILNIIQSHFSKWNT